MILYDEIVSLSNKNSIKNLNIEFIVSTFNEKYAQKKDVTVIYNPPKI
jgi:hypothetical protein